MPRFVLFSLKVTLLQNNSKIIVKGYVDLFGIIYIILINNLNISALVLYMIYIFICFYIL